jgi:hypothetical protein
MFLKTKFSSNAYCTTKKLSYVPIMHPLGDDPNFRGDGYDWGSGRWWGVGSDGGATAVNTVINDIRFQGDSHFRNRNSLLPTSWGNLKKSLLDLGIYGLAKIAYTDDQKTTYYEKAGVRKWRKENGLDYDSDELSSFGYNKDDFASLVAELYSIELTPVFKYDVIRVPTMSLLNAAMYKGPTFMSLLSNRIGGDLPAIPVSVSGIFSEAVGYGYSNLRYWGANDLKKALDFGDKISKRINTANLVYSVLNFSQNQTVGNALDIGVGILSLIPATSAVGPFYLGMDIVSLATYGKDFSSFVDDHDWMLHPMSPAVLPVGKIKKHKSD